MFESGQLYSSTMQLVNGVTNVKVSQSIQRADITVIDRGKPLNQRPVINYIPTDVTIDMWKRDNSLEIMLGLVNPTGIFAAITKTRSDTATYGIRSMQVYYAPTFSATYNSLVDIKSGVITNYSLQGSVSEPMRQSLSFQFLDQSGSQNLSPRSSNSYAASIIKPEGQSLTGIQFTGYGITGFNIQSFSLGVTFGRTAIMQLGTRFPVERQLTAVNATLQVQGYLEGLNNSMTGLGQYNCGDPTYGNVSLLMSPSCAAGSPTSVLITNPYLESISYDGQVGNFTTVSLSFSMPLGSNPLDTGDGSVLVLT